MSKPVKAIIVALLISVVGLFAVCTTFYFQLQDMEDRYTDAINRRITQSNRIIEDAQDFKSMVLKTQFNGLVKSNLEIYMAKDVYAKVQDAYKEYLPNEMKLCFQGHKDGFRLYIAGAYVPAKMESDKVSVKGLCGSDTILQLHSHIIQGENKTIVDINRICRLSNADIESKFLFTKQYVEGLACGDDEAKIIRFMGVDSRLFEKSGEVDDYVIFKGGRYLETK